MKSLSRKLFGTLRRIALPTILILLCTVGIAGAQSAQYGEYLDLFRKDGALASRINIIKKFELQGSTATAVTIDLKLQFISSFDLSIGGNAPKKWHWDRIKDFDSGGSDGGSTGSKSFILRVCDTTVPNEGSCRFTIVPHKSQMASDPGFCQNGVCNFPDQSTQSVGKIYHYTAVSQNGIPDEGVQNDKFNVVFNTKSFSTLQNGTLSAGSSLNDFMHIGDQKTYTLDMWYCAVKGTSALPTTEASSSIRFFGNLCGENRPYIKIAETSFKLPNTTAEAVADANTAGTSETVNTAPDRGNNLPGCSVTNGAFGSGTLMGCVARIVYYVVYWPIQWFAGLMGTLFDYFLGYSLSDSSYRAEFAVNGWKIVRDISNIFFIIILVWTGLSAVFNTEKTNMKHVIAQLILNALLINFSLFGTRVIIDLSNIVARVFYNSVHVCKGECKDTNGDSKFDNPLLGPGGYKSLSSKIVSSFNPQKIFNADTLNAANSVRSVDNNVAASDDSAIAGYFIIVSLIAAAIMFAVAMMFWKVAFMFIGRVVGLYVAMIFAPFAVLTKGGMPLVGGIDKISWGSWAKDLTNYALLAPIFVFFLYIIYSFLDTGFLKIITSDVDKSFFTTIISIAVPMIIVYFMINQGVKIAEEYAGDFGKQVQGFVNGALAGTALGVASGGLATIGRGTIGRAGSMLANSRTLRRWSGGNNWIGRAVGNAGVRLGERGAKAEFDMRNTSLFKNMGVDMSKGNKSILNLTRTSTDNTKGGVVGSIDRKEKRMYKRMQTYQLTGDVAAAQNAENAAWEAQYQRDLAQYQQQNPGMTPQQIQTYRNNYILIRNGTANARPETADEINLRRNTQYGARAARGTFLTNIADRWEGRAATAAANIFGNVTTGAGISAVGGELATERVAEQRVGRNVGRLATLTNTINNLNAQIAPLQTAVANGTATQQQVNQLRQLQGQLNTATSQRDSLNQRLTQ